MDLRNHHSLRFWGAQSGVWSAYGAALLVPWIGEYPVAMMLPNKVVVASAGMLATAGLRGVYQATRARVPDGARRFGVTVLASLAAGVALHLVFAAIFGAEAPWSLSAALASPRANGWMPELGGVGYHSLVMLAWSFGYLTLSAPPSMMPAAAAAVERRGTRDAIVMQDGRVTIRDGGRTMILETREIEWLSADGDYVRIQAATKTPLVRMTMTQAAKALDGGGFVRIHRSTLVNARHVRELISHPNAELIVLLRNGGKLKASRSYAAALRTRFGIGTKIGIEGKG